MRRSGGGDMDGSARVFVRPLAMLAIGLAAGLAMWRVLMADVGPGQGRTHGPLSADVARP